MSAILEGPNVQRKVGPIPALELEPESIVAGEPRFRFDPAAELERLRPLLADYDPRSEPAVYRPPRETGAVVVKAICYAFLGVVTMMVGFSVLSGLTLGC